MVRSTDFGQSWSEPVVNGHAGQSIYSRTTDIIVMLTGWPPAPQAASAWTSIAVGHQEVEAELKSGLDCRYYIEKYCKADAGKGATCLACLAAPHHQVLKRGLCQPDEVARFCKNGSLPAPPRAARAIRTGVGAPAPTAARERACSVLGRDRKKH